MRVGQTERRSYGVSYTPLAPSPHIQFNLAAASPRVDSIEDIEEWETGMAVPEGTRKPFEREVGREAAWA